MQSRFASIRRGLRAALLVGLLGFVLGACEDNLFEPCDPDGDTPHTPCPVEQTA